MLYIRADMNEQIATGHIMRCLSVADAVRQCGERVIFLLADEQALPVLEQRGFESVVLHSRWDDLESELPALRAVLKGHRSDMLLVDHYSVTEAYLSELRGLITTVYLDDVNAFCYPVDGLICYANYYKKFGYEQQYRDREPQTKFFLGSSYAPLRNVFQNCAPKEIRPQVRRLLILSGGADPYHVIRQLLERLELSHYEMIYAICGRYNPDYEMLKERFEAVPSVTILPTVSDLDRYMKEADAAVSAAGSTLYELSAVGTPAVSYTLADNQLDNARQFDEDGLIPYAGDLREDGTIDKILTQLDGEIQSQAYRRNVSARMQQTVDGNGAIRIARELLHMHS